MTDHYDVIIIGGGPAGYVGAIRAAQLGLKIAIIERRGTLGGTCLNVGCIPSKTLLQSSHFFEMASKEFAHHGIDLGKISLNLKTMMARKEKVVHDLTEGIEFLIKKNKIDYFSGCAQVTSKDQVSIEFNEQSLKPKVLKTSNIVVATGSEVASLPGVEIDENQIIDSTGALALNKVPKSMIVVGAGVIGLELGSVWRRLGSEVTVIEFLDVVLPGMDQEISKSMQRILKKQGLDFRMGTKVLGAELGQSEVSLTIENKKTGDHDVIQAEKILVSIGRNPVTNDLGLSGVGVDVDEQGFILIDEDYQTNIEGIFAVGDVIGGAMLAHKAEDEATVCIEIIAGQTGHINYDHIPSIVYTHPEIAFVGKTEEQLRKDGVSFNVGKFPFSANSRARCNADADGFVKLLASTKTDTILGCHIIGPGAGDLIQEVVVAMELSASAEDVARICHGHPGLPEAIKEAALDVGGRVIHR